MTVNLCLAWILDVKCSPVTAENIRIDKIPPEFMRGENSCDFCGYHGILEPQVMYNIQ